MKIVFASIILLASVTPIFAQPEQDAQTVVEERNKALIRRLYDEVFLQGKLEVADEIFAPHYVQHEVSSGWLGLGTPTDGELQERLCSRVRESRD